MTYAYLYDIFSVHFFIREALYPMSLLYPPDVERLVLEDPVDEGAEELPEAVLPLPAPVERHDHLHHHRLTRHHVRQPVNLGEENSTVVAG